MSRYRCVFCRKHTETDYPASKGKPTKCSYCGTEDEDGEHFQLIPQKPPGHKVYWDKRERDIVYWKDGTIEMDDGIEMTASGATGHLLHYAFDCVEVHDGRSLTKELEARGYDMTTLKFEIRKKVQ